MAPLFIKICISYRYQRQVNATPELVHTRSGICWASVKYWKINKETTQQTKQLAIISHIESLVSEYRYE